MKPSRLSSEGFTLFEILISLTIIGLTILPIMEAMAPALNTVPFLEKETILTNRARATLNRIRDLDFDTLAVNIGNPVDLAALFGSTAEAQKENFTHDNIAYQPLVVIEDESGGAGTLLKLSVVLDTLTLVTLKTDA